MKNVLILIFILAEFAFFGLALWKIVELLTTSQPQPPMSAREAIAWFLAGAFFCSGIARALRRE